MLAGYKSKGASGIQTADLKVEIHEWVLKGRRWGILRNEDSQ
jgi:hypothetical protein